MKKARAVAVLLAGMIAACSGAEDAEDMSAASEAASATAAHNQLTADEQAEGWSLLFDGASSEGWRGYGREDVPEDAWKALDGELAGQSSTGDMDGGDIITIAEFTDFDLVFDFKVGAEGNSGVFYRVKEVSERALWEVAAEYQVLDDPAYIAMGTMDMNTHLTGDNYDLHSATERIMNPTGEWNTGRILVEGNHVEHWLNGHMTVEYELYSDEWEELVAGSKFPADTYGRAPSGSIGLQDHGTPVWYRNMKIRRLHES